MIISGLISLIRDLFNFLETYIPVNCVEEWMSFDLFYSIRPSSWNFKPKYLMNRLKNAPNLLSMNNLFFETSWQRSFSPRRLPGFLLNRLRSRDWASGLRNWGIPSLALEEQKTMSVQRLRYENQYWGNKAHFKIIVMVSLRSFPWNGSVPVSISN